MKFEPKISGTTVTEFEIEPLFEHSCFSLQECIDKNLSQETMDWILDTLRFSRTDDNIWYAFVDHDTNYKLAVLNNKDYAEYRKEFEAHFGKNWMKYYIRFNH